MFRKGAESPGNVRVSGSPQRKGARAGRPGQHAEPDLRRLPESLAERTDRINEEEESDPELSPGKRQKQIALAIE